MANFDFFKIFKILCIALCAVFLLTACSSKSKLCSDEKQTSESAKSAGADCWQQNMIKIFYEHTGKVALKGYKRLTSENLLSLMMLAFTMWMAFQILGHVSTSSPESMGEFWTKIIHKAALCFVCGTLASTTGGLIYTLNSFIFPIYITILEFASSIMDITNNASDATALYINGGSDFQICETYQHVKAGKCSIGAANIAFSENSFPQEPMNLMGCMACNVADRLNIGYTIAMKLICMQTVIAVVIAILLVAVFTIAKLGFALYLVDSIFRMDMMLIILPFLIMFYPFEQTRKWSKVGFQFILNSSALMLCLVLVLSMTILAMENILLSSEMGISYDKETFSNLGPGPMSIIFLAFVIIKATSMAVTLSNSVTGGSGSTEFQKKMKAVVGTVARAAMALLSLGAGKVVDSIIKHSERARKAAEKVRKIRARINRVRTAVRRLAGRSGGR